MKKRPFRTLVLCALVPLELVHANVCGLINMSGRGDYEYFITFTDDYLRYRYFYLMCHQSESFDKFKEFKAKVEKQLGRSLKKFLSNQGGEYLSGNSSIT